MKKVAYFSILSAVLYGTAAWAWNPPEDTAANITARIEAPDKIDSIAPFDVRLVLRNASAQAVSGTAALTGIDDWQVNPASPVPVSLPAQGETSLTFRVQPGPATLPALYPLHARVAVGTNGRPVALHPIHILRAELPAPERPAAAVAWQPATVQPDTRVRLLRLPAYRAAVAVTGEDAVVLGINWRGSDPRTFASVNPDVPAGQPDMRNTIAMHPAWAQGRTGPVWIEYPIVLPAGSVQLHAATAIRNTVPPEPDSDGVTFRVRVLPFDAPPGQLGQPVFERHSASKTWEEVTADLSAFAGQLIRLQLECHSGPRNDSTCDGAFWADPVLIAGMPVDAPPAADIPVGRIGEGDDAIEVRAGLGRRGMIDGVIVFARGGREWSVRGLDIEALGFALSEASSAELKRVTRDTPLQVRHSFNSVKGAFDFVVRLDVADGALRIHLAIENAPAPEPWRVARIEDAALGPWSAEARDVYTGVGNVLRRPKAFRLGFDGHQLATSYAGFDFDGLCVVQGIDVPPDRLVVDPAARRYALHAPMDHAITLIPCTDVWAGVRTWRALDKRPASPQFEKLAGRFVFDLWGGNYAPSAQALKRAFRHGLTDSAVVWHNWQRWGYDYRLPEIFPPNGDMGSIEEFKALADTCKTVGVLFAPHDNYIDFYPDAEGFSYDRIAFGPDGMPIRGWLNEGRQAQAYRWSADAYRPFLEPNVALLKQHIAPTAFFIDVWSSIGPYDAWTRDGRLVNRAEVRDMWGAAFGWIRDELGDAPQISESGHDQLIGMLDGAQCNHLRAGNPLPEAPWMVWQVQFDDAERIPWIDAAYHDRFALHGAGYSVRYRGGLSEELHGIYSDDYMTTEVLTGHPAMVSGPFGRDVVRKYWLLHGIGRALAGKQLMQVDFADGDIHRQHVAWENGEAWVNRSGRDWETQGHILPPYGFYACAGDAVAAIQRVDGVICEYSNGPDGLYVNARPHKDTRAPVDVDVRDVRITANRQCEIQLQWTPEAPLDRAYRCFVHFTDPAGKILFQADHPLPVASDQWSVPFTSTGITTLPATCKPGDAVDVRAGLYLPDTPGLTMRGTLDELGRIRLGTLQIGGSPEQPSLTFTAAPVTVPPVFERMNMKCKPLMIKGIHTNGGCLIRWVGDAGTLIPLPDSTPFDITFAATNSPKRLLPIDEEGNGVGEAMSVTPGVPVTLSAPGVFGYRLERSLDK